MGDFDKIHEQLDRLWGSVSENQKNIALNCHKVGDVAGDIQEIRADIKTLEIKYDTIIQKKLDDLKAKTNRSSNIKIAMLGGAFLILTALISLVPQWLQ